MAVSGGRIIFPVGDAGDLARYGCLRWLTLLFGLVCVPIGFVPLNGLGPHFGLGKSSGGGGPKSGFSYTVLVLIVVVVEVLADSR